MSANLSLILNVLLLIVVIVAIGYVVRARREQLLPNDYKPAVSMAGDSRFVDDVIAVRKLTPDNNYQGSVGQTEVTARESHAGSSWDTLSAIDPSANAKSVNPETRDSAYEPSQKVSQGDGLSEVGPGKTIMFFLLAKDQPHFAGYELLQTILAAGLRFGEGDLFHRHQHANGQGPVLFSLATATESGVFDLQNIGAFNARGLCLFMQTSGNANIDTERYEILCQTAKQLSDDLGAYLLDQHRRPVAKESFGSLCK